MNGGGDVSDQKIASQYQLLVLGKRGNRLFIGAADPTDQEAAERIKFAGSMLFMALWLVIVDDVSEQGVQS
mgnify:CR=1 FL=1